MASKPTSEVAALNEALGNEEREKVADLVIWDARNPRALINIVPDSIKEAMDKHLFEHEELFNHDEHTLARKLRSLEETVTATDNRIRLRFWMEYDYAQTYHCNNIDISRVVAGICSREFFYKRYLKSPYKVAWLLTPPTTYIVKANEALEYGLEQLRELLEADPKNGGNKIDTKLGELKLKIVAMLEARVKGAVVQKSMSVHAVTADMKTAQAVAQVMTGPTMEELESRLKRLRNENRNNENGGIYVRNSEAQAE